jgi:hypothetical protein
MNIAGTSSSPPGTFRRFTETLVKEIEMRSAYALAQMYASAQRAQSGYV